MNTAPKDGETTQLFLGRGDPTGDLSRFPSKTDLYKQLLTYYGQKRSNTAMNVAIQFWNFAHEIQPGDYVLIAEESDGTAIAIGTVKDSYRYHQDFSPYQRHSLTVRWTRAGLDRAALQADLRASLNSLVSVRELKLNDGIERITALASKGSDPGPGRKSERQALHLMLKRAGQEAERGPLEMEVRELLQYWGHQQRSSEAVAEIKRDLLESGLTTSPPFTEAELHRKVRLVAIPEALDGPEPETAEPTAGTEDVSRPRQVVMLVGHRTRPTVPIKVNATIEEAWFRMTEKRYSQLAVVDDDGKYLGAVTTDRFVDALIGSTGPGSVTLRAVIDDQIPAVHRTDHLLDRLTYVSQYGFLFVYDDDRHTIDGILSSADLAEEFGAFVQPFMILEEIENHLRTVVDAVFTLDEIKTAASLKNDYVHSAANMMMGDYVKMLKKEEYWRRVGWRFPQALFLEKMGDVKKVRNAVMHFSPDPLTREQIEAITGFCNILRKHESMRRPPEHHTAS